jgi:tRNA 2-selenouridine synthase
MAHEGSYPVPVVTSEAVLARPPRVLIDLRSPAEFAEDHLPGAHNQPLFDDLERALIGTLYARSSPEAAFQEGCERTQAKIVDFTRALAARCGELVPSIDLEQRVRELTRVGLAELDRGLEPRSSELVGQAAVLYCWRGGLRSRAVVAFLRGLGWEVFALEGGYKSYRRLVRARLEAWKAPRSYVLRGLTGVGKTLVLRALAERRAEWVLDLEGLAGHRSSILGMVGLEPAPQKLFESRLAERLARGFDSVCVVEGESRKVGDLILPEPVWSAVDQGVGLELTTSQVRRVEVLMEDYLATERSRRELAARLPFLEQRLGARWEGELVARLSDGREAELVELLLEHYYDPLYRHSEAGRSYSVRIDSTDPARAAEEIEAWIEGRLSTARLPPALARSSTALANGATSL